MGCLFLNNLLRLYVFAGSFPGGIKMKSVFLTLKVFYIHLAKLAFWYIIYDEFIVKLC